MGADTSSLDQLWGSKFMETDAEDLRQLTLDQKMARLGELTTLFTLVSPLSNFIFCHKKNFEKNQQLSKISFSFLLAMMVTNYAWLSYSVKQSNLDILIINILCTIFSSVFVIMYLYVKFKVAKLTPYLSRLCLSIIFIILTCSSLTNPWLTGLVATTMSMCQYIFTLDGVRGVLQTKDPERVDLIIAVACILNAVVWGCYSYIIGDIFGFIPNLAAIGAGLT